MANQLRYSADQMPSPQDVLSQLSMPPELMEALDMWDARSYTIAFVAYWIDPEHKVLDAYPSAKKEVLLGSAKRDVLIEVYAEHRAQCSNSEEHCIVGLALENAIAAFDTVEAN